MELILSGYGVKPNTTISHYKLYEDEIEIKWSDSIENPSFVCGGDDYLFTITEADTYSYVYMYQKEKSGYQFLDQRRVDGGALCHITYSPKNKALFGACYASGTLFSLRVEERRFGELLHEEVLHSDNTAELTRAHCVLLNQKETQLTVINIALDMIYFYQIDAGKLKLFSILETPKGSGPRHAIYSKDETLLYVITEYSNELLVYKTSDKMQLRQRISTLTPHYSGNSNCSTLCFGKDNRFLYAANRGADTIAVFAVNMAGTLTWLNECSCGGQHPRHMISSQDGSYLIICNQHSNNVVIYDLDTETGALNYLLKDIDFTTPSGVLEIVHNVTCDNIR